MREHHYYLYILSNHARTLYIGVTNDLERRVFQQKQKEIPGFTAKYNIGRLVHFEEFTNVNEAIAREKVLKGWSRPKKIALIEAENPQWEEMSNGWYADKT